MTPLTRQLAACLLVLPATLPVLAGFGDSVVFCVAKTHIGLETSHAPGRCEAVAAAACCPRDAQHPAAPGEEGDCEDVSLDVGDLRITAPDDAPQPGATLCFEFDWLTDAGVSAASALLHVHGHGAHAPPNDPLRDALRGVVMLL